MDKRNRGHIERPATAPDPGAIADHPPRGGAGRRPSAVLETPTGLLVHRGTRFLFSPTVPVVQHRAGARNEVAR